MTLPAGMYCGNSQLKSRYGNGGGKGQVVSLKNSSFSLVRTNAGQVFFFCHDGEIPVFLKRQNLCLHQL